jgi:osmotically-inducible protein OsmY
LIVELPTEHECDDADIVRGAEHVLSWHSDLPETIQVSASNGWLTLSGSAQRRFQKDEAERAVRSITGVKVS